LHIDARHCVICHHLVSSDMATCSIFRANRGAAAPQFGKKKIKGCYLWLIGKVGVGVRVGKYSRPFLVLLSDDHGAHGCEHFFLRLFGGVVVWCL
jgi:hypothetical protein